MYSKASTIIIYFRTDNAILPYIAILAVFMKKKLIFSKENYHLIWRKQGKTITIVFILQIVEMVNHRSVVCNNRWVTYIGEVAFDCVDVTECGNVNWKMNILVQFS